VIQIVIHALDFFWRWVKVYSKFNCLERMKLVREPRTGSGEQGKREREAGIDVKILKIKF
jgi:hypothetical protein